MRDEIPGQARNDDLYKMTLLYNKKKLITENRQPASA